MSPVRTHRSPDMHQLGDHARARGARAARRLSAGVAGETVRRTRALDLSTHALAFGAQQLLCTIPLIVAVSAVVSHAPGRGVAYATVTFFDLDGSSATAVNQLLGRHSSSISPSALVVSMLTALLFTTSVGAVQQRAFELIWGLPHLAAVRGYLRQLAWAPTLAVFTIGMLAAARPGRWLDGHVAWAGAVAVVALRTLLVVGFYWWSQYWLLDRRVQARRLLPGSIAVAALSMALVEASRLVVPAQISWQVQAYGLVGVGFVLAGWLMILSVLIYVGVVIGALLVERRTISS